jgi:hypothetical protein
LIVATKNLLTLKRAREEEEEEVYRALKKLKNLIVCCRE